MSRPSWDEYFMSIAFELAVQFLEAAGGELVHFRKERENEG